MIAVISSCLVPATAPGQTSDRTTLSSEARFLQTIESITSLTRLGFEEIYLADNSAYPPSSEAIARLAPAKVHHFSHFPHRNKGIAEGFLLLALSNHLPDKRPIMKLSGRYRASINLCTALGDNQMAGLVVRSGRIASFSTRAYATKDVHVFRRFLQGSLDEIYASPWRVVGLRSLYSFLQRTIAPSRDQYPYSDPPFGLENAARLWLARHKVPITLLSKIGVEGTLGNSGGAAISE